MKEEFFITLLSNSSSSYFPDNRTTHFITQLPHTIQLEGSWVVGLAEIQYPCSLLTINSGDNFVYVTKMRGNRTMERILTKIKSGLYNDIPMVINELNKIPEIEQEVDFKYDKLTQKVTVDFKGEGGEFIIVELSFSPKLAVQLGFAPGQNLYLKGSALHPANLLLGLPSQMFIYCDIIEPQIVGDNSVKLLRNVTIDNTVYTYGSTKSNIFNPIHYIPVLKRGFENIEIDIRTDTGENIPFMFGTSSVKLHFKNIDQL